MATLATRLTILAVFSCALSRASFVLKDTYIGNDFYDQWTWETLNDPTHGRVNYVGLREAQRGNLTQGM